MKHPSSIFSLLLAVSSLIPHPSSLSAAGIPVPWTVDMRRAQPATFEEYQGETLDFQASLTLDGKPFEAPLNYSFFWQTNGMGRYYWSAPCTGGTGVSPVQSNVLFATWLPSYDCGARVYNCFIGSPSNNYHTAFQLRLRPSPGATPNALPLPVPVIDFAKVRVLNPPWEGGGGGGGVDTNAVRDIVRPMIADATNGIHSVDGAARPLPKYLHLYTADDSYPDAAAEYYRSRGNGKADGGCSSVRSGGFLSRNFDFPFDDRAEFVVKMSAGPNRFASVGVSQVGTNLTEQMVTSGKPEYSHLYKWLPGATVDGINENGVACNINVVDGDPQWGSGVSPLQALHPLAAVRWILDNATNAEHAATYIASHIVFPPGWTQNYHYMIADERDTYIVENGTSSKITGRVVMTNFPLFAGNSYGTGVERYDLLLSSDCCITNAWYTRAYLPTTHWISEFGFDSEALALATNYWARAPKEAHRGESFNGTNWWQSIHTSVYDLTNRVLRVAVQETDDWYVFTVPAASSPRGVDEEKAREIADSAVAPVADEVRQKIGGDEVPEHETDPTVPDWAKSEYPRHIYSGGGAEVITYGNDVYIYGGNVFHGDIPMIDNTILMEILRDYIGKDSQHQAGNIPVFSVDGGLDDSGITPDDLAPKTMISHTDPTFTNAVIQTMKGVTPQPSPTLRLYDEVRQCWWIGKMVNGVMQWEVE